MENSLAFSTTKPKLSILPTYIFKTATDTALSSSNDCKAHTSVSFFMQDRMFTHIHLNKSRGQLEDSLQLAESEHVRTTENALHSS